MKKILLVLFMWGVFYSSAMGQSNDCNVQIRSGFNPDCVATAYPPDADGGKPPTLLRRVFPVMRLDFTSKDCIKGCQGNPTYYYAESEGAVRYIWTVSGAENTTVIGNGESILIEWGYGNFGTIKVEAITSDSSYCSTQICVQLINSPRVESTSIPAYIVESEGVKRIEICLGGSIAFIDESIPGSTPIIGHFWGNENAEEAVSTPNYVFTPQSSGDYEVIHIVQNECGCQSREIYKITVREWGENLELSCFGLACAGSVQTYEAVSPTNCDAYNWSVEGGTIVSGSGTSKIEVQWGNPPNGYGVISLDGNYCPDACQMLLSVKVPILSNNEEISGNEEFCVGDHQIFELPMWPATEYDWEITPSSGYTLFDAGSHNKLIIKFDTVGTYSIKVRYSCPIIDCGTFETSTKTVTVKEHLTINSTVNSSFCQGGSASFNTNHSGNVFWEIFDEENDRVYEQTTSNLQYTFNDAGIFRVTAVHSEYCDTAEYLVSVVPTPSVPNRIIGQTLNCRNTPFSLTVTPIHPGYYARWEPDTNAQPILEGNSVNYNFVDYSFGIDVYLVDIINGCQSLPKHISIDELIPVAVLPDTIETCAGSSVTIDYLDQYPYTSFEWSIEPAAAGSIQGDHTMGSVTILLNHIDNQASPYIVKAHVKRTACGPELHDVIHLLVHPVQEPEITVLSSSICQGDSIAFRATGGSQSLDAEYKWTINNRTYYGIEVSAPFTSTGNSIVTLVYTPITGCTPVTVRKSIYVNPIPSVIITPYLLGLNTYLSVAHGNNTAFQWSKNGENITGATNDNCLVNGLGNYCCEVTFANTGCSNTNCFVVSVPDSIDDCNEYSSLISNGTSCNQFKIQATNATTRPTRTTWSIRPSVPGNTITPSATNNTALATATFKNPGTYTIVGVGTLNDQCYITKQTVSIDYVLDFVASYGCDDTLTIVDNTVYKGGYVGNPTRTITISGAGTGSIDLSRGETVAKFYVPVTSQRSVSIKMQTATNCAVSKTLTLYPHPTIRSVSIPEQICDQTSFRVSATGSYISKYHWNFGDNSHSYRANPYHSYTMSDISDSNRTISLVVQNQHGCSSEAYTITTTIGANPLLEREITVDNSNIPCVGQGAVTLTLKSPNNQIGADETYIWNPGNVTHNDTLYDVFTGGHYYIKMTNSAGCIATANTEVPVYFHNGPAIRILGQTTYCLGDTVKLYGNTGADFNYRWRIGNGSAIRTPDITYVPTTAGTQTVTLRIENDQCETNQQITVTVKAKPQKPTLSFTGNQCLHTPPVFLTSTPNRELNWSNGSYGITAPYFASGYASAYFIDYESGCQSAKDSIYVNPAPNYDALLTGCFKLCEKEFTSLKLNYFIPLITNPSWKWYRNGISIASGNNASPSLPIPGLGSYQMETTYGTNCTTASPTLNLELKDVCTCTNDIDITVLYTTCQISNCAINYGVTLDICNNGEGTFYISDFYTLSGLHIRTHDLLPLVVDSGVCKSFYFLLQFDNPIDFSLSNVEFVFYDSEFQCEKRFSIDINLDCIDNEGGDECDLSISPEYICGNYGGISYFSFDGTIPDGTTLVSLWMDPPYVYDYAANGTQISGNMMVNTAILSQMVENGEKVCFNAILCINRNYLCHTTYCINPKDLLEQINNTPCEGTTTRSISVRRNESDDEITMNVIESETQPYLAPNPAQNEVAILGIVPTLIKDISVFNMNGSLIATIGNTNIFRVNSFSKGTYIIRVRTHDNKIYNLKLIKQ